MLSEPDTKQIMLEALGDEEGIESIEGRPDRPTLPMVGSYNVNISSQEEETVEEK